MHGRNWDIFCNVVDNFGDVGVCWRLAKQLAREHDLAVRLWVDDLASLSRLCPQIRLSIDEQVERGVLVHRWAKPFPQIDVADVVIEAFACKLPDPYVEAMAAKPKQPVWINLEYLSAEDWVSRCHGLASPHSSLALTKYFFFPGFTAASGGLLREANLLEERNACQAELAASWQGLGLPPAQSGESSVSMFCYENPALPVLLHAWAAGSTRLRCLIPEGKALQQAAAILGKSPFQAGDTCKLGNLTICALPFLSQDDYDRLLWSCDLNFVRGEDSFVRAQWAARPMVWHAYPQSDDAHITKLEAFLALYCDGQSPVAASACRDFWLAWNQGDGPGIAAAWPAFWQAQPDMQEHARLWSEYLGNQTDMARQLVQFCKNLLQ